VDLKNSIRRGDINLTNVSPNIAGYQVSEVELELQLLESTERPI
jgi:hypothetical protein